MNTHAGTCEMPMSRSREEVMRVRPGLGTCGKARCLPKALMIELEGRASCLPSVPLTLADVRLLLPPIASFQLVLARMCLNQLKESGWFMTTLQSESVHALLLS
jgi:hypothetical protein